MYRLFIANKNYSSWSLRPWLLMRMLEIHFEEKQVWFDGNDNRDAFRAFSPSGRVPCLHDGDTVVWDSLGIVEYLAERHRGVWPDDPLARAWARCATAEMHSSFSELRTRCGMNCGIRVDLYEMPDGLRRDIERVDALWTEGLQRFGGPFLAGASFTAVDAFFAPVASRVRTYGLQLNGAAAAYAEHLLALPPMRDWQKAALAETVRDAEHERDARGYGAIIEDHRAMAV